jgi:Putative Actinobacterial Holin-X, holin superfamily III
VAKNRRQEQEDRVAQRLAPKAAQKADNPQQTIAELKDLVIAYAKQETVDPIKGLGRWVGYGLGGAVLLGAGVFFLAMAVLRALQTQTGDAFADWRSFIPYLIVVVLLSIVAGFAYLAARRRRPKT